MDECVPNTECRLRARLTEPALYDVSVRSLAALVRMRPTTNTLVGLSTHSQASSPRSVTLTQLPSPSTLPIGDIIWYTDLLEAPKFVQGLTPHYITPMPGVPKG